METRIFHSDLKPITANRKLIGNNVWLEFDQGDDHMQICLPARMDAAVRMIAEAFNAHIDGGPITRAAQVGFPSGGAMTGEAAFAIVANWLAQGVYDDMSKGREGNGDHAIITDADAARAVERRDLP